MHDLVIGYHDKHSSGGYNIQQTKSLKYTGKFLDVVGGELVHTKGWLCGGKGEVRGELVHSCSL